MADPLRFAATHAKWVLVAGLVMAVLLPGLAQVLAGWLVPLIVLIMFVGALRLAPERVAGLWARPGQALGQVAAMQLGLPLAVMALLWMLGAGGSVWGAALVLVLSAPAIVSSPNIAAILGLDALSAMRAVCWGTVLVPLTCLPALMFLFGGADLGAVLSAAAWLATIILCAGGAGVLVRRFIFAGLSARGAERLDGLSAIALAVFVIALMPALRSTFEAAPLTMLGWIALACAVNLGLQIAAMALLRQRMPHGPAGATALVTGNRNLALFFAALPAAETHGLLPFLAAYQLPMYLTPLLLGWLYVSEGGGKR